MGQRTSKELLDLSEGDNARLNRLFATKSMEFDGLELSLNLRQALHAISDNINFHEFIKIVNQLQIGSLPAAKSLFESYQSISKNQRSFHEFIHEIIENCSPIIEQIYAQFSKSNASTKLLHLILFYPNWDGSLVSYESFEECFSKSMYLQEIWTLLFTTILCPASKKVSNTRYPEESSKSQLLDSFSAYILSRHFSSVKSPDWTLIYSSKSSGKSWTIFLDALKPLRKSLIIIGDVNGNIFGCYANSQFKIGPNFTGDSHTFLFSIAPDLRVYLSSGINKNYIYLNSKQKTLPNGLGFGGQLDYFGLFISSSFESGSSKANPLNTTFSSPRLSKSEDFLIDCVEVLAIEFRDKEELEKEEQSKVSILNNLEASAFLEMSGKTIYSKNLREPEFDIENK